MIQDKSTIKYTTKLPNRELWLCLTAPQRKLAIAGGKIISDSSEPTLRAVASVTACSRLWELKKGSCTLFRTQAAS